MACAYRAAVEPDLDTALATWDALAKGGGALAFQRREWLSAWARTLGRRGDLDLLPVTVRDAAGVACLGLPLVARRGTDGRGGSRRIGFADGGLADYNAPIVGAGLPDDAATASCLWRAVRRALPACDLVRFERMPVRVGARVNPLAFLPAARPSGALGLAIDLSEGFDAWRAARPRRYRMELGRCARLFDEMEGARFGETTGEATADRLGALETMQKRRIEHLALDYGLDTPEAHAFHRAILTSAADASLFELGIGGRVVATLFGVRAGERYTMLRIAADPELSRISPARLLIVHAMERLAADGVRTIDLGLGDYPYKRRLGGEPIVLFDLVVPRSPLGLAEWASFRARAALRERPEWRARAKRLRDALPRFRPTASP